MRASKDMNSPKGLDPRLKQALAKMAERKGLRYVQTYLDSGAFDGPNREAVQRWIDIQRRALFLARLGPVLVGIASVVAALAAVIAWFKD